MEFKLKDFLKSCNITRQAFYKLQKNYGITRSSRGVYQCEDSVYNHLKTWYASKKKREHIRLKNEEVLMNEQSMVDDAVSR